MKFISKKEWAFLGGIFVFSFIPLFGGIARLFELAGVGSVLPPNPRVVAVPAPVVIHIFSVIAYCLLGAFQFLPSLRKHRPSWHRMNGRIVVLSGIVSALSGLWMTHFYSFPIELQGPLLYWVRILLGPAMAGFIVLAIIEIKKRNIHKHSAWMIRAYAIGQGASTQVVVTLPWIILYSEPTGLTRDLLMTLAWVINLILAEYIIRSRKIKLLIFQKPVPAR